MSIVSEKPPKGRQQPRIEYIRVLHTIPLCPVHGSPMTRYSPGKGRRRYYKCLRDDCKCTAPGTVERI